MKKNKIIVALACLGLVTVASLNPLIINEAFAQTSPNNQNNNKTKFVVKEDMPDAEGYINLKTDVKKYNRLSKLATDKLKKTPTKIMENKKTGLYELTLEKGNIIYITKDEEHLIDGALVNLNNLKVNITYERMMRNLPYDEKWLNFNDALKVTKGDGSRKMITFEDPNCGYCKKLANEIEKLNNVTIYTFMIPVLGPNSLDKSKAIWCAKDRYDAWDKAMESKDIDMTANCDTSAIDRNIELGKKLAISGTPTIFLSNGKRIPGYKSAEDLENLLSNKEK